MHFTQFHLPQLGHASFLVGDPASGTAIVVDPQVDISGYVEAAEAAGLRITHVVDTHAHSDYRSGRATLAAATGAVQLVSAHGRSLVNGEQPIAHDDVLELGSVWLRAIHVPGHAPEQLAFAVGTGDDRDAPELVLTGGSLMCGDIGRPDIDESRPREVIAPEAIAIIRERLLTLPDTTRVFPTHVAGSLCSATPDGETSSTIGRERAENEWLQADFDLAAALAVLPRKPAFWRTLRATNDAGLTPVDVAGELPRLTPQELLDREDGTLLVDARDAEAHAEWHPAGTLHLGASAYAPVLAGALLDDATPTVVLADDAADALRLAHDLQRVGVRAPVAWTPAARADWERSGAPLAAIHRFDAAELLADDAAPQRVLDVRQPAEWARDGALGDAVLLSLPDLPELGASLPPEPLAAACAAGRRAVTAVSVLRHLGRTGDVALDGGVDAFAEAAQLEVSTPA